MIIARSDWSGESKSSMFRDTGKYQEGRNALAREILWKDNFSIIGLRGKNTTFEIGRRIALDSRGGLLRLHPS